MSVDTPAGESPERPPHFACAVCNASTDREGGRFLASYSTDEVVTLEPAEADGLVPLCDSCTDAVTELTDTWSGIGRPPVAAATSIAESYASITDECSFCADGAGDGPILGMESWAPKLGDATTEDDHHHYLLCGGCVSIFEEFLRGITEE